MNEKQSGQSGASVRARRGLSPQAQANGQDAGETRGPQAVASTRGGTLIVAHEGQEVHNSLIDALVAQEIRRQNDARVAEALAAKQRAEDEAALMRRAYGEYWQDRITDAGALYARNPRPGRLAAAALVAWALVALAFRALFDAVGI